MGDQFIGVAIAGLGEFGAAFLEWMLSPAGMPDACILYCIEPKIERAAQVASQYRLPCYATITEVPAEILGATEVVVDCSAKGQGSVNLGRYRQLHLPAVFQNGEAVSLCPLFYEPLSNGLPTGTRYYKIARCSALSTCNVLLALQSVMQVNRVYGTHCKVSNQGQMVDPNYCSGSEITMLLGVRAHIDVTYLRGMAYGNYAYHGTLHIECAAAPSRQGILAALSESRLTRLVHDDIDTLSLQRGVETLVIEESIVVSKTFVRLALLSFTPEINFPHNQRAIRLLAGR